MITTDEDEDSEIQRKFLLEKVRVLDQCNWKRHFSEEQIFDWMNSFDGKYDTAEVEAMSALFLLSNFVCYEKREIRVLMKSMHRDCIRRTLVDEIKSRDPKIKWPDARKLFEKDIRSVRFIPLGNPSKSGSHLLYDYRQENILSKKQFINAFEIKSLPIGEFSRNVFVIDDFCGSGKTAKDFSKDVITSLKHDRPDIRFTYCVLFGFESSLKKIHELGCYDQVYCSVPLDDSYKAFSPNSRFFAHPPSGVTKLTCQKIANNYGRELCPKNALGFKDGQLLLSFGHNTPNNTLPIFWASKEGIWPALFPRK